MIDFLALLLDLGGNFLLRHNAPHFVKGIHVEKWRIKFTLVVGNRRVRETVELRKLNDVIPDLLLLVWKMCAPYL